jgi:hypothetical protein
MMKALEEKLELEVSISRLLYDEWEPTIKVKIKNYECNSLCDLGASISTMPKSLYDVLGFTNMDECSLNLHVANSTIKKPLGWINDVLILANRNYVPIDGAARTAAVEFSARTGIVADAEAGARTIGTEGSPTGTCVAQAPTHVHGPSCPGASGVSCAA